MDPERWRRIEAAFHASLELPPQARAARLRAEHADDPALIAEVERLLALDAGLGAPQAGPGDEVLRRFAVLPPRDDARPDPLLGRTIGAYRLMSLVAEGGMGVVYRGVRADGLFDHEVAVKLLRAGAASEEALARFDFERRTLAALNHPNVARLYDGGTTREGTPYLVMEFVHGLPIDRWCDEHGLELHDRLRLFARVCRAVHFAHQNLVVHGDLKPANLLVDPRGTVKLLDFGIARLLGPAAHPAGHEAGPSLARRATLEYASPEQLLGQPLTTAADVYSLGVLLHVLVTGAKPLRVEGLAPDEWERVVAGREPEPPSVAVRDPEHAARCGTTPRRLARALRGDVDRIAAMALAKQPGHRYASALQLAEDVERHLLGLPVRARDDTPAYRAWAFARRNRLAVGAALAVVAALTVGLVLALRAESRAARDARHARIEADSFREIAEITLEALHPRQGGTVGGAGGAREQARQALLRRAQEVRLQHAGDDHLRANLLDALGIVLLELGADEDAEVLVREAHAIRERVFGARSLEVALALRSLARLQERRGDLEGAAADLEQALALHRSLQGVHTDVASAARDLGGALYALGRLDEAARLHEEALGLLRAQRGPRSLAVADALFDLGCVHAARGDGQRAAPLLAEALSIRRAVLGEAHALTARTRDMLAQVRAAGPRPGQAAAPEAVDGPETHAAPDAAPRDAR